MLWHPEKGLNLQPAVLETAALPIELPRCGKRFDLRCFFARKAVVATIKKLNTPASLTLMLAAINSRTVDQKMGLVTGFEPAFTRLKTLRPRPLDDTNKNLFEKARIQDPLGKMRALTYQWCSR